jgi:hypothetical protein
MKTILLSVLAMVAANFITGCAGHEPSPVTTTTSTTETQEVAPAPTTTTTQEVHSY